MGLTRPLTFLLVVGVLVLAVGYARAAVDRRPAYTVRELRAILAYDPEEWVGRTLLVRGLVRSCPYPRPGPCASWQPELRDPGTPLLAAGAGLLLVPVPTHPTAISALLRRIPWGRALLAPAQQIQWGAVATYRVQIRVRGYARSQGLPCFQALLLDAAPGTLDGR